MPQTVVSFAEAEGPNGLVLEALLTTGTWPMPLVNIWHPLYTHLARKGRAQGAKTVLTGAGGDEMALGRADVGGRLHPRLPFS